MALGWGPWSRLCNSCLEFAGLVLTSLHKYRQTSQPPWKAGFSLVSFEPLQEAATWTWTPGLFPPRPRRPSLTVGWRRGRSSCFNNNHRSPWGVVTRVRAPAQGIPRKEQPPEGRGPPYWCRVQRSHWRGGEPSPCRASLMHGWAEERTHWIVHGKEWCPRGQSWRMRPPPAQGLAGHQTERYSNGLSESVLGAGFCVTSWLAAAGKDGHSQISSASLRLSAAGWGRECLNFGSTSTSLWEGRPGPAWATRSWRSQAMFGLCQQALASCFLKSTRTVRSQRPWWLDNLGLITACQLGQQGGNDKNIIYCVQTLP